MRKPRRFTTALSLAFGAMLLTYCSLAAAGYWCVLRLWLAWMLLWLLWLLLQQRKPCRHQQQQKVAAAAARTHPTWVSNSGLRSGSSSSPRWLLTGSLT